MTLTRRVFGRPPRSPIPLSGHGSISAATSTYGDWILMALVVVATASASIVLFPVGFQGADDWHYLKAAEEWLQGPVVATDHWGLRLPFVLAIAASIGFFGVSQLALIVPQVIVFSIAIVATWWITRMALGPSAARLAIIFVAITPVFFWGITESYPDIMEAALSGLSIALALSALWQCHAPRTRSTLLLLAGVFMGFGLILRETGIAVPICLILFIFYFRKNAVRAVTRDLAWLITGPLVIEILETCWYFAKTGNLLYRFTVDSHHVLIPSAHLRGQVFTQGSPLLNWRLAPLWDVQPFVNVHWSVNGFLNLFFSPSILLTSWLGFVGLCLAWRARGRERQLAALVCLLIFVQYALNTFVLVLPPEPRYAAITTLLLCPFAGLALAQARLWARACATALAVSMLVLVALVKAPPALMVPIVDDLARQHTPLYVSAALYNVSYVKMYSDPFLARALRVGTPPDGGYAILDEHGWSRAEIARVCSHSTDKWRVITTVRSPSMIAKFIDISGAGRHLPSRIIKYLDRDDINVVLARRSC